MNPERWDEMQALFHEVLEVSAADRNAAVMERLRTTLNGQYEVRRELGSGGMALVFLAEDVRHGRNKGVAQGACKVGEVRGITTPVACRHSISPR